MNLTVFHRLLLCLALGGVPACSFDPGVQPPGFGDDATPNGWTFDADGTRDAPAARDASGGHDGAPPNAATPDMEPSDGATPDMTTVPDATVVDMAEDTSVPTDQSPPVDMSRPPDMASMDMGPDVPGPSVCDGMTVDLATNPDHCGQCDNACDPVYGSCTNGSCECAQGADPCGPDNLCEDLDFDSANCGACGNVCPAGEVCIQGGCECRSDLTRCNGVCVNLDSDPSHCGQCDENCGGDVCLDGSCEDRDNCPFGQAWTCDSPGGKACLRGQQHHLHCDPGIGNQCGTECGGDEICTYRSVIRGWGCEPYRPGIGCTDCPCADCTDGEECFTTDSIPDVAFCVND